MVKTGTVVLEKKSKMYKFTDGWTDGRQNRRTKGDQKSSLESSSELTRILTNSEKAPPKVSNSKVKDQRVKVMVSNERSCQKEYTCEI
jgi:hypothetical protein